MSGLEELCFAGCPSAIIIGAQKLKKNLWEQPESVPDGMA